MKICPNPNCHSKGEPQPLDNFYLRLGKYIYKECKKCTNLKVAAKLREKRLKKEALKPKVVKQKKKFTEEAKQALGYYELY